MIKTLPERKSVLRSYPFDLESLREQDFTLKDARELIYNPEIDKNDLLVYSSEHGWVEIVKKLLNHPQVDPSTHENKSLILASKKGHLRVVEALLEDGRVDPSAPRGDYDDQALTEAVENSHFKIVKLLLKHGADPTANDDYIIIDASEAGHLGIFKTLIEYGADPTVSALILNRASNEGHDQIVRFILQKYSWNPEDIIDALKEAAAKGHAKVVEALLKKAIPSRSSYELGFGYIKRWETTAIIVAAQRGHTKVVKVLSDDYKLESSDLRKGLREAILWNYPEVAKVIIGSHRVKITPDEVDLAIEEDQPEIVLSLIRDGRYRKLDYKNNLLIRWASQKGYFEIVDYLLSSYLGSRKVDPSFQENEPIRLAVQGGHSKVVRRLLQDENVIESIITRDLTREAHRRGYPEIVGIILREERDMGDAIVMASELGYPQMVKSLIQRYKSSAGGMLKGILPMYLREALNKAIKEGHLEVVKVILNDPKSEDPGPKAITQASEHGHLEIVKYLTQKVPTRSSHRE